jgi:predicted  nucleic acid-binding Zn-ribbon protein
MSVMTPISWGELVDKVTILAIKLERIQEPDKLAHVKKEQEALLPLLDRALALQSALASLEAELKAVNARLWEVEDQIRDCERQKDFGPQFIVLARAVYHENDRRASLKRQINLLLDSDLVEEKSYKAY